MIVHYKKRYVFIHIPKTGGETVRDVLFRDGARLRGQKHFTYRDAVEFLGESEMEDFFFFSFVRNPWDQAVSFYEHLRKPLYMNHAALRRQYNDFDGVLGPKPAGNMALEMSFEEWCREIYAAKKDPHGHFLDQSHFITDARGNMKMNFVGHFENFCADMKKLVARFDLPTDIPHLNKSRRSDYRGYYSPQTAEIIRANFAGMIRDFGYTF